MSHTPPEWYAFRDAIEQRNFSSAEALFRQTPGLLNERNRIGETVLHFLAVENDLEGVAWLHQQGADLNGVNKFGTPLLFEVALLGYESLARWLIRNGADTGARDSEGRTVIGYLTEYEKPEMAGLFRKLLAERTDFPHAD